MDFFKGFAVHADELPDAVFTAIGRTVWADIGPTAVIMRLVMKVASHHVNKRYDPRLQLVSAP